MEIKDMADILLKGGKMLSRSCPGCNAPLFQHEGRTFCARCGWEEGKASTEGEVRKPEKKGTAEKPRAPVQPDESSFDEPWSTLGQVQAAILSRVREYAEKVSDPGESANIHANLEVLSVLLDVLERIVEMKGGQ